MLCKCLCVDASEEQFQGFKEVYHSLFLSAIRLVVQMHQRNNVRILHDDNVHNLCFPYFFCTIPSFSALRVHIYCFPR